MKKVTVTFPFDGRKEEFEEAFLIDHENCIVFDNGQIFLLKVINLTDDLYSKDEDTSAVLLGDDIRTNIPRVEYAKRIIRHLQRMSIFSYMVQKHFYNNQATDDDWGLTNI